MILSETDNTGETDKHEGTPSGLGFSLSSGINIGPSGGTVHHHGQSPSRGIATPRPNLQQTFINMNPQPQSVRTSQGGNNPAATAATKVLQETKPTITPSGLRSTFPNLTAFASQSGMGPSPQKKVKVEEIKVEDGVINNKKFVLENKCRDLREIKENYNESLSELFFLQNGGNMMDYFVWKKRPTPQLVSFLKSGKLDSEDEDDLLQGQEIQINNEVCSIHFNNSTLI